MCFQLTLVLPSSASAVVAAVVILKPVLVVAAVPMPNLSFQH
jgi:hypothetical protein